MKPLWNDCPIVYGVQPPPPPPSPACPHCGSERTPLIVRSEEQGDGSLRRKCICKRCSARFVMVLESYWDADDFDDCGTTAKTGNDG